MTISTAPYHNIQAIKLSIFSALDPWWALKREMVSTISGQKMEFHHARIFQEKKYNNKAKNDMNTAE